MASSSSNSTCGYQLVQSSFDTEHDYPGFRFGHTLTAVTVNDCHYLILFGGVNAVIEMRELGRSFQIFTNAVHCFDVLNRKWTRVYPDGEAPSPRAGHAAAAMGTMIAVQGGIGQEGVANGDLYFLEVANNEFRWFRFDVRGESPGPRYGHVMGLASQRLVVFGGRGTTILDDAWALDMQPQQPVWERLTPYGAVPSERMYASASTRDDGIFVLCGGRDDSEMSLGDTYALEMHNDGWWMWSLVPGVAPSQRCLHSAVFINQQMHVIGGIVSRAGIPDAEVGVEVLNTITGEWVDRNEPNLIQLMQRYRQAAAKVGNCIYVYGGLRDDVLLNDFLFTEENTSHFEIGLNKRVISTLLRPEDWTPPASRKFFLNYFEIAELCHAAEQIIAQEPTVLQLQVPIKVFGDLHGQFGDLMRIFHEFGSPSKLGDISYIDYLFLGDYVDRGKHSLETITLLLALKIEYPNSFHLIRGNHESSAVNETYGFLRECIERLGHTPGIHAWMRINSLFNHLPLAALIQKKVFCVHGGIGSSVHSVEQVSDIPRPILPRTESKVVKDILWSDPTQNDSVLGIMRNSRGADVCSFGPDVVKTFCDNNNIDLILRAHECVLDGFERFADGKLITLFSATNYCGTSNNAGAILVIGRDLQVYPKLIHPRPPFNLTPENAFAQTWEELDDERPPSPVRGAPNA